MTAQHVNVDIKLYTFDLKINDNVTSLPGQVEIPDGSADVTYEFTDGQLRIKQRQPLQNMSLERRGVITVSLPATSIGGKIKLGTGNISSDIAVASSTVKTGAGDIQLVQVDSSEVKTGAGDIHIGTAEGVELKCGSGAIRIDELQSTVDSEAKTGVGGITIDRLHGSQAGKTIELKSGSGDISVRIMPDTATYLDVKSGLGAVSSELEKTAQPDADRNRVRLQAKTGVGDIIVSRV